MPRSAKYVEKRRHSKATEFDARNRGLLDIILSPKSSGKEQECARVALLDANDGIVLYLTKKYAPLIDLPFKEVKQYSILALLACIPKYDAARGYKFSTYAVMCIMRALIQIIRRQKEPMLPFSEKLVSKHITPQSVPDFYDDTMSFELHEAMERLEPVERDVLTRRFGFSAKPERFMDIAQDLGLTALEVKRIERYAKEKVKKMLGRNILCQPKK